MHAWIHSIGNVILSHKHAAQILHNGATSFTDGMHKACITTGKHERTIRYISQATCNALKLAYFRTPSTSVPEGISPSVSTGDTVTDAVSEPANDTAIDAVTTRHQPAQQPVSEPVEAI